MGKFYDLISDTHVNFINKQHLFFVSTAPLENDGHVNVSPKGLNSFKVLSPNKVAYMDVAGSGNETTAHLLQNGRITFMFCSFENVPNILRLYGKGFTILPGSSEWVNYAPHFQIYPGTRQIIAADIHLVQTSCGFGVPLYTYNEERQIHFEWAEKKGPKGLQEYIENNNLKSLDDLPTPLSIK
ncbi:MAG TPA: pyridoxamine 5'-phosphate oxidase family protein [Segetibacter sp.]|jgi:hypothetical protein